MTKEEIKETAEGYRLALMTGFASMPEVVAWAEGLVGSEAEPDFEIIEIASATGDSLGDLVSKLTAVQGTCNTMNAVERLFAHMGIALATDPTSARHIAGQLRSIAVEQKASIPDDIRNKMFALNDGFELASNGTGATMDKLQDEVASFLEQYRTKYI
jgi:hypothetical protein